ncbi:MAG TPA: hypothetical protein VFE38_04245 [Edaphobacter sp.]|nr:hypothetical protein [Edaphobacter sp.]
MNLREFLLLLLVGWTAVGIVGVTISAIKRERRKALQNFLWIIAIWIAYLGTLIGISLTQPQRSIALGQDRCFDEMCFAVMGSQQVPGYLPQDGSRLIRVSVRISNHGKKKRQSEKLISAYLIDRQGRKWSESSSLSGVRLTVKVAPGDSVMSEPVFRVAKDSTGLGLIFTHGDFQPGVLVIGDSDSLLHRRTVVWLGQ